MMSTWKTTILIDGYDVNVTVKQRGDLFFAQADSYFHVATIGDNFSESLERLKKVFLVVRELVFYNLITHYGILKAKV